jgi:hypothetical protein
MSFQVIFNSLLVLMAFGFLNVLSGTGTVTALSKDHMYFRSLIGTRRRIPLTDIAPPLVSYDSFIPRYVVRLRPRFFSIRSALLIKKTSDPEVLNALVQRYGVVQAFEKIR